MSVLQKKIYKKLPVSFTTADGVKVAVTMGMSERTFKSWLTSNHFIQTTRGHYDRRYK
jgi:hypothetical protein